MDARSAGEKSKELEIGTIGGCTEARGFKSEDAQQSTVESSTSGCILAGGVQGHTVMSG